MQAEDLAVGHAGEVVAGGPVFAVVLEPRLELRAEVVRMLDQQVEKLLEAIDEAAAHGDERRVMIEAAVEELEQLLRAA